MLAALDTTTCTEIADIVRNPQDDTPYQAIKAALIDAFGLSQHQRNQQLLTLTGLGDRKPTSLLRYMKRLTSDSDHTLLRALFLQQLPADV